MNNTDKNLWDYHQTDNRNHLKAWYPRQDLIYKQINRLLKKWSKTLEIWFWDWYLLNKLSNNWYNVYWQDLSEKNIEATKKQWNNNDINFVLWDDSWKFNFGNNILDWFIASEVLEHMNDDQLDIAISEIYRILKEWWYAFLTFPAKEKLKNNECSCPNCWEVFHKWWHKQYWDEEKIKSKFKDFNIMYLKSEIIKNWNLNIFWKMEYFLRKILTKVKWHLDWNTYFIVLKK